MGLFKNINSGEIKSLKSTAMLPLSVWKDFSSVIKMAHLITKQIILQVHKTLQKYLDFHETLLQLSLSFPVTLSIFSDKYKDVDMHHNG